MRTAASELRAGTWYQQDLKTTANDRFNITFERQLPGKIVADITYFVNRGNNAPYSYDVNQVDPRIALQNGIATTATVTNPFFNVLPSNLFPGQLRTRATVPVSELLRPYPQYGSMVETLRGALGNRYQALQMQFQRPFSNGFNFVVGYNYNRERNQEFFDGVDGYTISPTWQNATNARHRITGASVYQIPFGHGRQFGSGVNKLVDYVLGGWSLNVLATYNSGVYLRFGTLVVNGDPSVSNPAFSQWFNTSAFSIQPAFTRLSLVCKMSGPIHT